MCVDFLYKQSDDPRAVHDIIWSDGPSSEFKNKFMTYSSFNHSVRSAKAFLMEIFATSHRKGVVDGIGDKAKSLVQVKVMSKADDRIIVQFLNKFSKAAEQLLNKEE